MELTASGSVVLIKFCRKGKTVRNTANALRALQCAAVTRYHSIARNRASILQVIVLIGFFSDAGFYTGIDCEHA